MCGTGMFDFTQAPDRVRRSLLRDEGDTKIRVDAKAGFAPAPGAKSTRQRVISRR
jgi:hypothetical protein